MAEDTFDPTFNAQQIGTESSLSNWVGPYVTDMLGKGKALADQPYQSYGGPLTAGPTDTQTKAFQGIGSLNIPTSQMGTFSPSTFTGGIAQQYMNPYLTAALQPQIDEARRQSEIDRIANASRLTQSGAFGGSRQAIMDSENQRNLQQNLAGITGQGYSDAYNSAMNQFNVEQGRQQTAQGETNKYGLAALDKLYDMGAKERGIESEGVLADKKQFEEERDYPYKQVQYMQSLLQGLPVGTTAYNYTQPSTFGKVAGGSGDVMSMIKSYLGT
tara:strand:- start:21 stop:836 length:816 start_codon:yes stop_codon:yes gene_type:complete